MRALLLDSSAAALRCSYQQYYNNQNQSSYLIFIQQNNYEQRDYVFRLRPAAAAENLSRCSWNSWNVAVQGREGVLFLSCVLLFFQLFLNLLFVIISFFFGLLFKINYLSSNYVNYRFFLQHYHYSNCFSMQLVVVRTIASQ